MQNLNYCRQMLAEFQSQEFDVDTGRIVIDLTERVRSAVKFMLPEGGVSIDDFELRALDGVELKLPFDKVVLEFAVGHSPTGQMVKAVVLCQQFPESVRVTPLAGRTGEPWSLKDTFDIPARDYADKTSSPWGLLVPENSYGVALWVLLFLNALACSNVRIDKTVSKARKAMGKKGALPFDDYHVLTIEAPGRTFNATGIAEHHRSPREHLRRGHIRRLQDGRRLWVNATVVNAGVGGKVQKDYRISA